MSRLARFSWKQSPTASSHPAVRRGRGTRARWACVALVATALASPLARADVEWHPDLDTAHAAARISRRPVIAVFVAGWDDQTRAADIPCLRSREAEAVLAACFEPVRIDIDQHADLTRAAGVTHVPAACVLAADDTVLDRFEMTGRPAAFVTAAILAAQRIAAQEHGPPADRVAALPDAATPRNAAETVSAAAFGSGEEAGGPPRAPRGSMARVAAKVRDLSSFATGQSRPDAAPSAPATTIATASRNLVEPRSDYAPLTWPAEKAAVAPTAPTPPPAIEPLAQAAAPTTAAPWLDAAQQTQTQQQPAASQPSAPLAAAPEAAPAAQPAGLWAALQKPFGLGGKPAAAPTPTMPPALPSGPLAALMPTKPPAAAAGPATAVPATADAAATAAATATTDVHGSMPLGLEGYCPVSLVDRGAWTEGRAQWGARHRGRTYLFAGQSEQQTFLADPDRYAPALSGDDPVLALDRGSSTPGQRRFGVTYQARIYLFASAETRTAFTADPARYTTRVALAERPTPAAGGTRTY